MPGRDFDSAGTGATDMPSNDALVSRCARGDLGECQFSSSLSLLFEEKRRLCSPLSFCEQRVFFLAKY